MRLQSIKANTALHIPPMPIPNGDEIVRVRLEQFVAEIGESFNPEQLGGQWPALPEKLRHLSNEEIFHLFLNWKFSEMVEGYRNAPDLNQQPPKKAGDATRGKDGKYTRMFINLGEMDGFDWKSLRSLISDLTQINAEEILDVSVTRNAGFFNVPTARKEWVYDQVAGMKFRGRRIRVDVDDRGGEGGGNRGDRQDRGDRPDKKPFKKFHGPKPGGFKSKPGGKHKKNRH